MTLPQGLQKACLFICIRNNSILLTVSIFLIIDFPINVAEKKIEPIPALLQDVIDRLDGMQVFTTKPDSCIVDIYNEVTI